MVENLLGPASWSSSNTFVSGAGDLQFKSLSGQFDTMLPWLATSKTYFVKEAMLLVHNNSRKLFTRLDLVQQV